MFNAHMGEIQMELDLLPHKKYFQLITYCCCCGQKCRVLVQPLRTAGLEAVLDVVVLGPSQVAVEKPRDLPSEDPVYTLVFAPHQSLEVSLPVYSTAPRTFASSSAVNIISQSSN